VRVNPLPARSCLGPKGEGCPMVERLQDVREPVVGIKATGEVASPATAPRGLLPQLRHAGLWRNLYCYLSECWLAAVPGTSAWLGSSGGLPGIKMARCSSGPLAITR
jgi:hypothetical protein